MRAAQHAAVGRGIMKLHRRFKVFAFFLVFVFVLSSTQIFAQVPTTVTANQFTISVDKEQFHCEPVLTAKGCLVIIEYEVTNELPTSRNYVPQLLFEHGRGYELGQWLRDNHEVFVQSVKNKTAQTLSIGGSQTHKHRVEIFATESSKFNISVSSNMQLTILDPIINVTIDTESPSYHLINGTNNQYNRDEYENYTEISAGLSDDSDSTEYRVNLGEPQSHSTMILGMTFNEITGSDTHDYSFNHLDGTINGDVDLTNPGIQHTSVYFDGDNDYIVVTDDVDFDVASNEDFLICVSFNNTEDVATDRTIVRQRSGTGDGYRIFLEADEQLECVVDRGAAATPTSTATFIDGQWHTVCCYNNVTTGDTLLYIDGAYVTSGTSGTDSMEPAQDLGIGADAGAADDFEGGIDELCMWKEQDMDPYTIINNYNNTYCLLEEKGDAVQPYFDYTIDDNQDIWMKVDSDVVEDLTWRVYAHDNHTEIDVSNYEDFSSNGLINYFQLDNVLSGITPYDEPFRVYLLDGSLRDIHDVYLISSENDTIFPSVQDCTWNQTDLGCDESIKLTCNVTDDLGIQSAIANLYADLSSDPNATGNIDEYDSMTSITEDTYQKIYTDTEIQTLLDNKNWGYRSAPYFNLLQVEATDLANQVNSTNYTEGTNRFRFTCLVPQPQDFFESFGSGEFNLSSCNTDNSTGTDNYCDYSVNPTLNSAVCEDFEKEEFLASSQIELDQNWTCLYGGHLSGYVRPSESGMFNQSGVDINTEVGARLYGRRGPLQCSGPSNCRLGVATILENPITFYNETTIFFHCQGAATPWFLYFGKHNSTEGFALSLWDNPGNPDYGYIGSPPHVCEQVMRADGLNYPCMDSSLQYVNFTIGYVRQKCSQITDDMVSDIELIEWRAIFGGGVSTATGNFRIDDFGIINFNVTLPEEPPNITVEENLTFTEQLIEHNFLGIGNLDLVDTTGETDDFILIRVFKFAYRQGFVFMMVLGLIASIMGILIVYLLFMILADAIRGIGTINPFNRKGGKIFTILFIFGVASLTFVKFGHAQDNQSAVDNLIETNFLGVTDHQFVDTSDTSNEDTFMPRLYYFVVRQGFLFWSVWGIILIVLLVLIIVILFKIIADIIQGLAQKVGGTTGKFK